MASDSGISISEDDGSILFSDVNYEVGLHCTVIINYSWTIFGEVMSTTLANDVELVTFDFEIDSIWTPDNVGLDLSIFDYGTSISSVSDT